MTNLLVRIVNARYSVPAWLWVFMSLMTGLVYLSLLISGSPDDDYVSEKMPFGGWAWCALTISGALATMYGMARHRVRPIRIGSMLSFFAWLFLAIAFGRGDSNGTYSILITCIPMLLFWLYKYMASYLRPPSKGA